MLGKIRRPSPAMVIALVALFAALAGTAVGATVLSKKQVKKIANTQANKVFDQRKGGLQGQQGLPGQDATKLFGYIREGFQGDPANLQYGSGVTAVSDPDPNGPYTVTFNRSLVNCVVQAVAGAGDPVGSGTPFVVPSSAEVSMDAAGANQVEVEFRRLEAIPPDFPTGSLADTSFLITAFC